MEKQTAFLYSASKIATAAYENLCKAEFCITDPHFEHFAQIDEGLDLVKDMLGCQIVLRAKFKKRYEDDSFINVIISNKIRDYMLMYNDLAFKEAKIFKYRVPNKVSDKLDTKHTGKKWYRVSHDLYVLRVSLDDLPSNDDGYFISIMDIPKIQVDSIQIENNELTIYSSINPKYMLSGKDEIIIQFIPFKYYKGEKENGN